MDATMPYAAPTVDSTELVAAAMMWDKGKPDNPGVPFIPGNPGRPGLGMRSD